MNQPTIDSPWPGDPGIRPIPHPEFLTTPGGSLADVVATLRARPPEPEIPDVENAISGPWP
jgi:hypothetical protein